ncbi:MAG: DUF3524 domain-containing protein [Flavobacteriales bacterium]
MLEPFFGGSHKSWAEGLQNFSSCDISVFGLKPKNWKWLMHAGAIELADKVNREPVPDLFLVSDMMDLALFKSLLRAERAKVPVMLYFHENQLMYPRSEKDTDLLEKRDNHYGFMNYTSCLVADKIAFNSQFHLRAFFDALAVFLKSFPDSIVHLKKIEELKTKSLVLHPGIFLDQRAGENEKNISGIPVILWNHRWEYDKNPEDFFQALFQLKREGINFELVVLGEQFRASPPIFEVAKQQLKNEIIHWGFVNSLKEYMKLLKSCDILPVTSVHDFFGISVVEAIACGVIPLLPNDLAYPEHLPSRCEILLYERGDFLSKLRSLIKNFGQIDSGKLQNHVSRYSWKNVAKEYDNSFMKLINDSASRMV